MFTGRIQEISEIESVIDERIVAHAPKSAGRVRAVQGLDTGCPAGWPAAMKRRRQAARTAGWSSGMRV